MRKQQRQHEQQCAELQQQLREQQQLQQQHESSTRMSMREMGQMASRAASVENTLHTHQRHVQQHTAEMQRMSRGQASVNVRVNQRLAQLENEQQLWRAEKQAQERQQQEGPEEV